MIPGCGKVAPDEMQGGTQAGQIRPPAQFIGPADMCERGREISLRRRLPRRGDRPIALLLNGETKRQIRTAAAARRAGIADCAADRARKRHGGRLRILQVEQSVGQFVHRGFE